LTCRQDTIAILPANFGIAPEQALIAEINKKYANRVLHDVGLCICVFDLVEAGEGRVRYGDGCLWYKGAMPPFSDHAVLLTAMMNSPIQNGRF